MLFYTSLALLSPSLPTARWQCDGCLVYLFREIKRERQAAPRVDFYLIRFKIDLGTIARAYLYLWMNGYFCWIRKQRQTPQSLRKGRLTVYIHNIHWSFFHRILNESNNFLLLFTATSRRASLTANQNQKVNFIINTFCYWHNPQNM